MHTFAQGIIIFGLLFYLSIHMGRPCLSCQFMSNCTWY